MKRLKALKAVYSYMFPEVRNAIFETVHPGGGASPREIFEEDFLSEFFGPPDVMDAMHEPVLQKWVDQHPCLIGIKDFKHRYPTAGSEEGIREFMTYGANRGLHKIAVLKGEYEGYKEVAKTRMAGGLAGRWTLNIATEEFEPRDALKVKGRWFFISNPSARDGNIIPNEYINKLCDAGNYVFYDLAYLDSTKYHEFDLSHPNIKTVVVSASKAYGLFYWRWGALFSREDAIPQLYGNKWFKVVPSILVMNKVLDTIDPVQMVRKYRKVQQKIVKNLQLEYDLPFRCSDAVILAHIKDRSLKGIPARKLKVIEPFRRGHGYRFCLKPYFEEEI